MITLEIFIPRKFRFLLALTSLASLSSLTAQDFSGQVPGMSGEISIKSTDELQIKAPEGSNVAVLDQSWVPDQPEVSQVQNHHSGWLKISDGEVSWPLKIKGKLFVPTDAKVLATSVGVKVIGRREGRWATLADVVVKPEGIGEWIEFEADLTRLDEDSADGELILALSAAPFAGPVYLDAFHVTDSSGGDLWPYPSFE